ncbi:hypothetical protein [Paenibacillus thalictri]|uniref:Uncharacterized protein n=1 Tax=Paenibacillus thalictri TaxID=2527873 RepID=A0A4Q9DNP5_9BACL|nr:hypothetical protein [Paenibacillus thalictri]TBL75175.1 hypothetical protein EYB31_23935 [Paenibacillus thalictri]
MKGTKHIVYMAIALGMLFYAIPKLDIGQGMTLPTVFGVIWICFALLIIAAHLHEILGVDEEARKEHSRIKRMKKWQLEQLIRGKRKQLQFRK